MTLAILVALQAAAAAPAPPAVDPTEFDLASLERADGRFASTIGCRREPGEITVCAQPSGGGYDFDEWARIFATRPLVAETHLTGSLTGRAYVESHTLPNGMVSKRAMVGIRLPF
jgi:hypothetical protein